MTVTEEFKEDKLVLSIEGRIETNTAPEFQNAVLGAFQKCSNVILDFEDSPVERRVHGADKC